MTHYSMVIRDGLIVDGSGRPGVVGDVAIQGDRIVEVGRVTGDGDVEIDARGQIVAPGFIDVHTHYDPQLCWDKVASPTPEHGVTSLVMGNCSVSLAPVRPEGRDTVARWFGSVEDMEGSLFVESVPFAWESVGEYLDYLRKDLGPNVGSLIGHAVLRAYVMGQACQERAATEQEIATMCDILRQALRDGGFGLSFTFNHLDDRGEELPCSMADRGEIIALMKVVAEEGRIVEVAPNLRQNMTDPTTHFDMFGEYALETGATVSLSPILIVPGNNWQALLATVEKWRAKGAPVFAQTQVRPLDIQVSMARGSVIFTKTPSWRRLMDSPVEDRLAALSTPEGRARYADELKSGNSAVFGALKIVEVHHPDNKKYFGRQVGEAAAEEGVSPYQLLLDIVQRDDLKTEFLLTDFIHADAPNVAQLLMHPAMHIGSADAGAHITSFSGAGDTTYLLQHFVRDQKLIGLEHAVRRLTSDLAKDWHIKDRGLLEPGHFADVVVFDLDKLQRGDEVWLEDVPGGAGRYVRAATGYSKVIVNGKTLVEDGAYTDARPGRLI